MTRDPSPRPPARRPAGAAASPTPQRGARAAGEAARDPRAASGYPSGARTTPVPDLLFSRDLTTLDNPLALRVLLWLIWQVHRRPAGAPPAVPLADLTADLGLRRAASTADAAAATAALTAACGELVARGLVLDGGGWFVVNDRSGREALDAIAADPRRWPDLAPARFATVAAAEGTAREDDPATRPTIFALYEQTIGLVTPVLADELAEAAAEYPPAWVAHAFRLAAANGARKWSYVRAILTRWQRDGYEGDDDEIAGRRAEATRRPDSQGPYAAWIKH